MIYIYTGAIHTGKTTALKEWLINRNNVGGFLTPDEGGVRKYYDIDSDETFNFQVDKFEEGKTLEVGPYIFDKEIFRKGNGTVELQVSNDNIRTIVIDELGKLEMKGLGFYKAGSMVSKHYLDKDFIIVVRDYLVHSIAEKFQFSSYSVIRDINYF